MFIFDISPYVPRELQMPHLPYRPPVLDLSQDVVGSGDSIMHLLEEDSKSHVVFELKGLGIFLIQHGPFCPIPRFWVHPRLAEG